MLQEAEVLCPKCKSPLDPDVFNQPDLQPCGNCKRPLQVRTYPALYRPLSSSGMGELVIEGEASCFFHPQKQAVSHCGSCGRFVCALCQLEISGQNLCPECLEKGVRKKKLEGIENRRFLYDTMALQLAVLPMVLLPFAFLTIATAPAVLYTTIRYWRQPLSLVRRSRWRFVVASLLALVQITGWAFLILQLAT